MRAIRFSAVGADPLLTQVPVPRPPPGQVRVAMRACGICGSDLHVIDGSTITTQPPITIGTEPGGGVDAAFDFVGSPAVVEQACVRYVPVAGASPSASRRGS